MDVLLNINPSYKNSNEAHTGTNIGTRHLNYVLNDSCASEQSEFLSSAGDT